MHPSRPQATETKHSRIIKRHRTLRPKTWTAFFPAMVTSKLGGTNTGPHDVGE